MEGVLATISLLNTIRGLLANLDRVVQATDTTFARSNILQAAAPLVEIPVPFS